MAGTQPAQANVVEITRTFATSPEKVFDAWTVPEKMARWLCRGKNEALVTVREADLRVGGRLRLETTSQDGRVWKLRGEYREVRRPQRLAFTWAWENAPEMGETLVTVEFRPLGKSNFTEVRLRHEGFLQAPDREGHNKGWIECFDRLDEVLGG